jgi:hypothetical protein
MSEVILEIPEYPQPMGGRMEALRISRRVHEIDRLLPMGRLLKRTPGVPLTEAAPSRA